MTEQYSTIPVADWPVVDQPVQISRLVHAVGSAQPISSAQQIQHTPNLEVSVSLPPRKNVRGVTLYHLCSVCITKHTLTLLLCGLECSYFVSFVKFCMIPHGQQCSGFDPSIYVILVHDVLVRDYTSMVWRSSKATLYMVRHIPLLNKNITE